MKLSETVRLLNSRRTMVYILGFVLYAQSGYAQAPFSLPTPVTDLTGLLDLFTDEILDAAEAFEQRTGVEAKVLAAYRFAPDSPFGIESLWSPVTADALLFAINTNEYPEAGNWNWEENVKIFASQNIITDFPASLRDQTISNIMIPILEELPDSENRVYEAPEKYAQAIIQALQYMADVLEGPYFLISDRKYYSGSVAYLGQADDEVEELAAFLGDGTPFPGSSSWSGVTGGSGHIATFFVDAPSAASAGDPVSISYDNAGTLEELAIHIVVVKVTFRKHPDQVYGFDDNPVLINSTGKKFCYPSYVTSPPKDGIPWKSVEVGKPDFIFAEISPEGIGNKVFISSDSPELTLEEVSQNQYGKSIQVFLNSIRQGEIIKATLGYADGPEENFLLISSYPPGVNDLYVVEAYNGVVPSSSISNLPSEEEIRGVASIMFMQGVNYSQLTYLIVDDLKYDTNENGKTDVPGEYQYSTEMTTLFANCLQCQAIATLNENAKFIFIVDLPPLTGSSINITQGRFVFPFKYGFVFPTAHTPDLDVKETIVHEFGHGCFNLLHPFKEFNTLLDPDIKLSCAGSFDSIGIDPFNIMDYGEDNPKVFRNYQWNEMH